MKDLSGVKGRAESRAAERGQRLDAFEAYAYLSDTTSDTTTRLGRRLREYSAGANAEQDGTHPALIWILIWMRPPGLPPAYPRPQAGSRGGRLTAVASVAGLPVPLG